MSLASRIWNALHPNRVNREIDEELDAHIAEAIEAGRDPEEARRALGPALRIREESRDVRMASALDSLRSDAVFGVRQLIKNKVTSGAAVLSLALAIGACTSAFRLIDAALLRPLPVAAPERLHVLTYEVRDRDGKTDFGDSFEYPLFRLLHEAAGKDAELLAISYPRRTDLTYGSDHDMERIQFQYVSGWTFTAFGLKPALGRLLATADDLTPGAHPVAVLSHHYWTSRFGRDPNVLGRSFRMGKDVYQIVGVAPERFTGTEPGTLTDLFVPTMMNALSINNPNWSWFRTWVQLAPGVHADFVREKLQAAFRHFRAERAANLGGRMDEKRIEDFINAPVILESASAGVSGLQKNYRRSLYILAVMVALVLLIACANVANLMIAQASARGREMALRVSIGAGRSRLIQLVLVESALLALLALLLGCVFAAWAAPFVVSMIGDSDNPVKLVLATDWRFAAFAVLLAIAVTFLFGMVPAMRASSVKPITALKGGRPVHTRHRMMHALVAAQVAFCFLVHFVAGMFIASFDRLANQPPGFSAEKLLILETNSKQAQPVAFWNQITEHLNTIDGVESASLCIWPLMGHSVWSTSISIDGRRMDSINPYLLSVSPEWLGTMRIPLLQGRGFRPQDRVPAVAVVTEAFAQQYLNGESPVGRSFTRMVDNKTVSTTIVGVVADVRYSNMRESIRPVVFYPVTPAAAEGGLHPKDWGSFVIRTTSDPALLASSLRQEISRIRPEFRVASVNTQKALVASHTVRERLLAILSLFFATVSLVLAGVGLYGVLNYSVVQRRREIGIRMALGAKPFDVARRITAQTFGMLVLGAAAGLAGGIASEHYIDTLLYQVSARDLTVAAVPAMTILLVALIAAVPPIVRAVRTDPSMALRTE